MADEKMETRIRVLEEKIDAQARELERLKKQPAPLASVGGTAERTLGEAEFRVHVDVEKGTIGGGD